MDQKYHFTTSLPSINDMLDIMPGRSPHYNTSNNYRALVNLIPLAGTSRSKSSRAPVGHRRHASEYISSASSQSMTSHDTEMASSSLLPPVPTRSLEIVSTPRLSKNSSNSGRGPVGNSLDYSPSSSPLSITTYQDDKNNNNNIRTQQTNFREKYNVNLSSPHLPPLLQLMQPKFRSFTTLFASGSTTSLPLDIQPLSIPSSNASSHVSSYSSSSYCFSGPPNRRITHSRSLSDFSYSSSSISHDNRWRDLQQQSAFQILPPVITTASKKNLYFNNNNNNNSSSKDNNNNHILSAATLNINNNHATVQQSRQQQQQQQQYDPHVTSEASHSQHHFQNSADVHRSSNNYNDNINDSATNTSVIITSTAGNRYTCAYCRKRFSRPSSLRTHTYSHTGERPFICTVEGCRRGFSVHSNLRRHLRIHETARSLKSLSFSTFTVGYGFCVP